MLWTSDIHTGDGFCLVKYMVWNEAYPYRSKFTSVRSYRHLQNNRYFPLQVNTIQQIIRINKPRYYILHLIPFSYKFTSIWQCFILCIIKLTQSLNKYNIKMNPHFSKHIDKINSLIGTAKEVSYTRIDSIGLISQNISRSKITSKITNLNKTTKSIKSVLAEDKEIIPKKYQEFLHQLYESKCKDLKIEHNQKNWTAFVKAFLQKNKKEDTILPYELNLNDFNFQQSSLKFINIILRQNPDIIILKLSKNLLNPNKIIRLQTLKELVLNNCKLGNQALDQLFVNLHESVIQRISLSSPEIKNRNTLTRYQKLISLIQHSQTLTTLQLSNIQIHPDSQILQSSKNRTLKVIDLSDNTNVKGISPTIKSLNLSRNNITYPFAMPIVPHEVEYLNLSYNKIPYFHFKEFLKVLYFSRLEHLVLDHINLNGDVLSIQFFLQQSIRISYLSLVDCDLSLQSFSNITSGIKSNKSLKTVDLTRNRVSSQKIADLISLMLQNSSILELKMRHCDIKDHLGMLIFKNIRKNKYIQKIDMMNNLLGDETSMTICEQLKYTKNLISLQLQQNIIKYKNMKEIMSFLEGNKYYNMHALEKDYKKMTIINKQVFQSEMIIQSENEKLNQLEKQTAILQQKYIEKYKQQNKVRKQKLIHDINALRTKENQILQQIMLRQSFMDSSLNVTSMGIQQSSSVLT